MRAIGLQWGVGMLLSLVAGALTYVVLVNIIRRHPREARGRLAAAAAGEGAEPD